MVKVYYKVRLNDNEANDNRMTRSAEWRKVSYYKLQTIC